MNRIHKSRGFTLLEVMLAVFVLSVGMLSTTTMMLLSQDQAESTNTETIAAQRVWNAAELLRGSVKAAEENRFDNLVIGAGGAAPGCITTGCTASTEFVDLLSYMVGNELNAYMPNKNPQLKIVDILNLDEDSVYKITMTWEEAKKDAAGVDTHSYEMIFQL